MRLEHTTRFFMAALWLIIWNSEIAGAADSSHKKPAQSIIQISIQRHSLPSDEASQLPEQGSVTSHDQLTLNLSRTALLLVDVWKTHERNPDDRWLDTKHANIRQKIVPLLDLARRYQLLIIHLPHRQEIAEAAAPLPGEIVCNPPNPDDSRHELLAVLQEHQVTTLLYAGYTSNLCVLYRPIGILAMRDMGYQTLLLRDCTIAFVPKDATPQTEHALLDQVKPLWGITTTLDDLRYALQDSKILKSDKIFEGTTTAPEGAHPTP